jgi:hypothetical protein
MTDSNFGTLITIAGVAGMKVISVGAPVMKMGTIETTNHSTGDWRQFISDNLRSIDAFDVKIEASASQVAAVYAVWHAHVPVACVFTEYNLPAWSFNAVLLQFDLGTADATKPELETITIKVQPTSTVTLAAAATNWYDDVAYIMFGEGGAYTTAAHPTTHQMVVWAMIPGLPPHQVTAAQMADLSFASVTAGTCTIAATGIITTVASGTSHVTAAITTAPTIETLCLVTVP